MQTPIVPVIIQTFPGAIAANRLSVSDSFSKNEKGVNFSYRLEKVETDAKGNEIGQIARADGVYLSPLQWNEWGSGVSDSEYILNCVAANLGLVRA